MGVTFYGTVDVGYAYVHNGSYPSGSGYWGAGYSVFGSAYNHREVSTLNDNALQLSNVGLKIEEKLGGDFIAIGKSRRNSTPFLASLGTRARPCSGIVASRFSSRIKTATAAAAGRRSTTLLMAG